MLFTFVQPYAVQYDVTGNFRWVHVARFTAEVGEPPRCHTVKKATGGGCAIGEVAAPQDSLYTDLSYFDLQRIVSSEVFIVDRYTSYTTPLYKRIVACVEKKGPESSVPTQTATIYGSYSIEKLKYDNTPIVPSCVIAPRSTIFCTINALSDIKSDRFGDVVYEWINGKLEYRPSWNGETVRDLYAKSRIANISSTQSSHKTWTVGEGGDLPRAKTSISLFYMDARVDSDGAKRMQAAAMLMNDDKAGSQKSKFLALYGNDITKYGIMTIVKNTDIQGENLCIHAGVSADVVSITDSVLQTLTIAKPLAQLKLLRTLVFNLDVRAPLSELVLLEEQHARPHELPTLYPTVLQPNPALVLEASAMSDAAEVMPLLDMRTKLPNTSGYCKLVIPHWYKAAIVPATSRFDYIFKVTHPQLSVCLYPCKPIPHVESENEVAFVFTRDCMQLAEVDFANIRSIKQLRLAFINNDVPSTEPIEGTNYKHSSCACVQGRALNIPPLQELTLMLGMLMNVTLHGAAIKELTINLYEMSQYGWARNRNAVLSSNCVADLCEGNNTGGVCCIYNKVNVGIINFGISAMHGGNRPAVQHIYFYGGVDVFVIDTLALEVNPEWRYIVTYKLPFIIHVPKGTKEAVIQRTTRGYLRKCRNYLKVPKITNIRGDSARSFVDAYKALGYTQWNQRRESISCLKGNKLSEQNLQEYWETELSSCIVDDL